MRCPRVLLGLALASALACAAAGSGPESSANVERAGAAEAPTRSPPRGPANGSPSAPTDVSRNLLVNAGFEVGREPWTHMAGQNWGAFDVVPSPVKSGGKAALLEVAPDAPRQPVKVFGVVQEIRRDQMPGGFPETLSGWYRVESWEKGAPETDLYLQAVVIIWGDPRTDRLVGAQQGLTNYQIRFYLSGLVEPAFVLSNARLDFVTREASPRVGEWVRFSVPVKQKFQELWGTVPDGYEFIRVLYEARWDNRPDGTPVEAEVLYDDLFFGYGEAPDAPH